MADDSKIYPASSSELSKILNLDGEQTADSGIVTAKAPQPGDLPVDDNAMSESESVLEQRSDLPMGLPIAEADAQVVSASQPPVATKPPIDMPTEPVSASAKMDEKYAEKQKQAELETTEPLPNRSNAAIWNIGKKILPYVVVFAIGVGIYYFYFSSFSFNNLFKSSNIATVSTQNNTEKNLATLKKTESANYAIWISQFFFDVQDKSIIDMDTDVSGNGLTNFQKYLLNLNPKIFDTRGDSVSDGQAIIEGKNPWTGLVMTDGQKKIADAYFDNEIISNRITAALANHQNSPSFSLYVSSSSPYYQAGVSSVSNGTQPVGNGVAGIEQPAGYSGTVSSIPANQQVAGANTTSGNTTTGSNTPTSNTTATRVTTNTTAPKTSPTAGVNAVTNNIGGSALDIDTNVPGQVNVPSVKISVPVIWTSDVKNFDADLKKGVVHFPGTPLPGDVGSSYISGHSSGYLFDKSPYKQAFAAIGNTKDGDSFTVTVTLHGGQKVILHYTVAGRAEYAANDQRQFLQTPDSVVALSTCWPINTTVRRLVVFGKLTQIEK